MRVAIVIQRFGREVIGGAEALAWNVVNHAHQSLGWNIEVLTTQARDADDWANMLGKEEALAPGILIRRFPVAWKRPRWLFAAYKRITIPLLDRSFFLSRFLDKRARPLVLFLERMWIILQGPFAPGLVSFLRQHADTYDAAIFFTYLYYPTLAGIHAVRARRLSLIIAPCAHDEMPFYFRTVGNALAAAQAIAANSPAEFALLRRAWPQIEARTAVTGAGATVTRSTQSAASAVTAQVCEPSRPFALYVGRISRGKGLDDLVQAFVELGANAGLDLVLAGPVEFGFSVPTLPWLHYLGVCSEADKVSLLERCRVVVNPSAHESLSFLVLEAMLVGKPALVSAKSEVLSAYARNAATIRTFRDAADLARLLRQNMAESWDDPEHRSAIAAARLWVEKEFSWNRVVKGYEELITGHRRN